MSKKLVALTVLALAAVPALAAEEMRGGQLLEKALYSPGELLNRPIQVTAAIENGVEVIRDGTGASFQKFRVAPEVGKGIFFPGAVFYCVNVNGDRIQTGRKYTFLAAYLETRARMPLPGTVGGGVKEVLFACGSFS